MSPLSLSILIPLYDEEEYIATLLDRVLAAPLPEGMTKEVIVVDDGSSDGSAEVAGGFANRYPGMVRLLRHRANRGKGAAVRTALEAAQGQFCLIQDADLEYDPAEYPRLLKPLVDGRADVVYGSRFLVSGERRVLYFYHALANHILTGLCNLAADLNLTDVWTCYKAGRTSLLRSIPLQSDGFGIEPELTIKLARRRARIYETPISYNGRTYEEGKKIGVWDALASVVVILRSWLTPKIYREPGAETLDALAGAENFNRWMADTVQPFLGKRVLEIGAGIGNLSRHLARRRERYIATDIETEHLSRLLTQLHHRPNLQVCRCDLGAEEDFRGLESSLDTVVCLNVLEHVADEMAALRNIHRVLEPGGRAVILVPCGPELYGSLDQALGHHRRYTREELRDRLTAAGFLVDRILDFNRASRPGWLLRGRILKRSTLGRFDLRLFDSLVWLWRRVDPMLPWGPVSIIAVCTKPK
ncbi:MAG: glycosyltransferase [Bryobacteraceae bacterium]